ncbi:MAG: pyridoxal 5'-phosphate synthase glutaminase subunit PdxT [Dehalococcoidia bacterium]
MRIGVMALQGGFAEHISILSRCGVTAHPVRLPSHMDGLDGIVIPGGESTALKILMRDYGLIGPLRDLITRGLPVLGTCAGMVLLAQDPADADTSSLGVMHVEVERNAFGRQADSFESELSIPVLGDRPFPGVFVRAPLVKATGDGVEVLCRLPGGAIVAARQENRLACSFHPELTDDLRFHKYFLSLNQGDAIAKGSHRRSRCAA